MANTQVLIGLIQKRLDDSAGTSYDANRVLAELQLASSEIQTHPTFRKYLFPTSSSSLTVVTGQVDYALPTDYNFQVTEVIIDPTSANAVKLNYVRPDEAFDRDYMLAGTLAYYTVRNTTLTLIGTPLAADNGKTIKIRYSATDGTYLNDTSETTLGKRFPHLLVNKVCYEISMSEQDGEIAAVADRFGQAYRNGMELAVQSLSQGGTTEPKFMQVTGPGLL